MTSVQISTIDFSAGTQVRAAMSEDVVTSYAERMQAGDVFPPVVLFHDGNAYYMADGFHRSLAAQRNGLSDIPAEVRPGTRADALWFALGANKANGQRLTAADLSHAVALGLQQWPEKMLREIAEQVGCSQSLVSKVLSKNTGVQTELRGRALKTHQQREKVRSLVEQGVSSIEIRRKLKAHTTMIADVRAELGKPQRDSSRAAVSQRRDDIRQMAGRGFTSRQIAPALGISQQGLAEIARKEGIHIHADRATRATQRHDSNRIVDQMALDADNLTADVHLIVFADLDKSKLAQWCEQFEATRKSLASLIRRLNKEQAPHEEVIHSQAV